MIAYLDLSLGISSFDYIFNLSQEKEEHSELREELSKITCDYKVCFLTLHVVSLNPTYGKVLLHTTLCDKVCQ